MSLHSGIDTYAFISLGLYTKNYSAGGYYPYGQANINSLFVSLGLLEGAPPGMRGYSYALTNWGYGMWKRIRRSRRR